ncbi:universal stress protein [Arthrobacter sp. PAMC25564]|uniref:universal stress protein n=1 Tax=Arthrobacter sp. PAMC25564 TaxID=2565366 RepID=UPI0010A29A7E|nr:universal stress protein [Arthrobacter sp. PAMC25564]QCB96804.1 universal stress protein [Arthrobacter sp. PAMC25564]
MDHPDFPESPAGSWPDGPVVLGAGWDISEHLVRTAVVLATGLGLHLICAFVDPAGYLTEWEPARSRTAASLDPAPNEEAPFPPGQVLQRLEAFLGPPGAEWTFRALNGDVALALGRLAESTGASLLIVGGQRPGVLARIDRFLERSVSAALTRTQTRPVLVVPGH